VILYDLPDSAYHQRSELSSTGARRILDSPARYRWYADHPEKPKQAFDLGSAAHAKILGVGAGVIQYPEEHLTPSGNVSTKAATVEWEQEQRANGLIPISASDARRIDRMAEAVLADRDARCILETIQGREVTIIQEIDGVPVRARFDVYGDGKAADLKTCRDASPKGFNRSVGSYGYAVQAAWYSEAHEAETGRPLDAPFWFICVEATAPHLVGVYDLDFMWQDIARTKTARAREIYRACTETNTWPAYGTATLTPPTWAVYENEEQEIQV
jgi:exodeoxyribonuclease VIII